jgi:hypothetical protein
MSSAYRELQQALADTGRRVSATQLERWAYWRIGGLTDRPVRRGAGRGTRSAFPNLEQACEQAAAVADVLRPRMRLDTAALLLHGNGHRLLDEDVKAALLAELETAQRQFLRNARVNSTSDPHEQAWNAAFATYRLFARGERAQRRRRAQAELPNPQAWTVAGHILLGHEVTRGDLKTLWAELPIPSALLTQDPVSQLESLAKNASFPALIATAASLPAETIAQMNQTAASAAALVAPSRKFAGHDSFALQLGITLGLLLGEAPGAHQSRLDVPDDLEDRLRAVLVP